MFDLSLGVWGLLIVSLGTFLLASLILFRNPADKNNRAFAVFSMGIGLWSLGLALFIISDNYNTALWLAKLFYCAPIICAVSLSYFAKTFPKGERIGRRFHLAHLVPVAILFIITIFWNEFLLTGVVRRSFGNEVILNPNGYVIYSAFFLIYFASALIRLNNKRLKASGLLRNQLNSMVASILIAGIFGIIFDMILPGLGNYSLIWVGPQFTILIVAFLAYSISRHRLFDIRLVVARSMAYTMLLGTLAFLYGIFVFASSSIFFQGSVTTLAQQIFNIIIAIFLAMTFQPLKRFFDRITNKIFFQDRYDTQNVLDQINSVLTSQIELSTVTGKTLHIICENLKLRHGMFIVLDERRIYQTAQYNHAPAGHDMTYEKLQLIHKPIIITDELESSSLKNLLTEHDVAVSLRLKTQEGIVGFVFLGAKNSGNIYNNQDAKLLELLSKELALAVQNARSFEKIADFNITLQERIEEATKRLAAQNKKLKELDEAKDEFVSMASHQLRTPLTAIKGYISMLQDGDAGKLNKQQANFADLAYTSAQRMVFLISDMLNVSRINTGKLVIEATELNLETVIKDEIAQLQRTAESRGVILHFHDVKQKIPNLMLDEGKMRQVVMNFIDNAIYYAPNSTIEIFLDKVGDRIRFRVVDHGIGVPEKEKHNLFAKFYRAGNAKQVRPDGTGLGLFMAKMVVEMQGGQVLFESIEGKGSTFGFSFPEHLPNKPVKKLSDPAKPTAAALHR